MKIAIDQLEAPVIIGVRAHERRVPQTLLVDVEFFVDPPDNFALARHRDWIDGYGDTLMGRQHFSYSMVDFREIVMAPPRQ